MTDVSPASDVPAVYPEMPRQFLRWHLRSFKDQDTHLGLVPAVCGGAVLAVCGERFVPFRTLDGQPADPAQVCSGCMVSASRERADQARRAQHGR